MVHRSGDGLCSAIDSERIGRQLFVPFAANSTQYQNHKRRSMVQSASNTKASLTIFGNQLNQTNSLTCVRVLASNKCCSAKTCPPLLGGKPVVRLSSSVSSQRGFLRKSEDRRELGNEQQGQQLAIWMCTTTRLKGNLSASACLCSRSCPFLMLACAFSLSFSLYPTLVYTVRVRTPLFNLILDLKC